MLGSSWYSASHNHITWDNWGTTCKQVKWPERAISQFGLKLLKCLIRVVPFDFNWKIGKNYNSLKGWDSFIPVSCSSLLSQTRCFLWIRTEDYYVVMKRIINICNLFDLSYCFASHFISGDSFLTAPENK